tara:strand:+ start:6261 stop:7511 length:1251 start_codon:yes stop_codon:yes gene_type:complete
MAKVKSARQRAQESVANYQGTIYDAMANEYISDLEQKDYVRKGQAIDDTAKLFAQGIKLADNIYQNKEENVEFEGYVADLEGATGEKFRYEQVSMLDVLSGKNEFKDIFQEKMSLGGESLTKGQIEARAKLLDPETIDRSLSSGWKYGDETRALSGTQKIGYKAGALMDPEVANKVGKMIYEGQGFQAWSTRMKVLDEVMQSEQNKIYGWFDEDEQKKFYQQKDIYEAETSTESQKEAASEELMKMFKSVSKADEDGNRRIQWDDIKGFIEKAESKTRYDIGKNLDDDGKLLSYDIGPYQINSNWIMQGDGSFELTEDKTPYALYDNINEYLDSITDFETFEDTSFYGEREGFYDKTLSANPFKNIDWADLRGDRSIFKKYRNQDVIDPFETDEEGNKRKEALLEAGLINEYWEVY